MSAAPSDLAARRILARARSTRTIVVPLAMGEPRSPSIADRADIDRLSAIATREAADERSAKLAKRHAG